MENVISFVVPSDRHPQMGSSYYRAILPTIKNYSNKDLKFMITYSMSIVDLEDGSQAVAVNSAGTWIVPRYLIILCGGIQKDFFDIAKKSGQKMILSIDDDVFNFENYTPMTRDNSDNFNEMFKNCDGVVTSTDLLATRIKEYSEFTLETLVLPNLYPIEILNSHFAEFKLQNYKYYLEHNILRVGTRLWTKYRVQADFIAWRELFTRLKDKCKELNVTHVQFFHIGSESNGENKDILQEIFEEYFPGTSGKYIPFQSMSIPVLLASMPYTYEIELFALGDHRFNEVKTRSHGIEAGIAGLPCFFIDKTANQIYKNFPTLSTFTEEDYTKNYVQTVRFALDEASNNWERFKFAVTKLNIFSKKD